MWIVAAMMALPLLQACGGSSGSGEGSVRLVNAAAGYASLDLYTTDTLLSSGVALGAAGSYATVGAGSNAFQLKTTGSGTTAATATYAVTKDTAQTLVAYTTSQKLKTVFFTDNQVAPTTGTAAVRVFNASDEAGTLDVYLTGATDDLSSTTPSVPAIASERISSYQEIGAGTYRLRVTAAGSTTDLRLDLQGIVLNAQQILTLVLTSTPGGVLVNGVIVAQQAAVTSQPNPLARVRLVAGAANNGVVAATVNGVVLSGGLQSPGIGNYTLVNASSLTLNASLNGGANLGVAATAIAPGTDNTLLVTSNAGTGTATLLTDDNRPSLAAGSAKLRLVHGIGNLPSMLTLTANYSALATDVATNSASASANVTATPLGTTTRLEVTSPTAGSLFLATGVDGAVLTAGGVYTVWMLGDVASRFGVLLRDR